ncbi:zona pellucida sperm-binding protein 3-like isoform X2 [Sinocyclocheilus grahami]|uniref:Zona pellucida sperm-binding protein 3 n=1 Tax=Sinocyclocheilus grahami TaxID=75366 RepID=A0A672LMR1_SINGR|nr:PREDICTED: zona pellucida sperm-binding protein 3-like isoform X2 [Sinocyclocheilus grahami]
MGLRHICFGLVAILALCLSEAQWQRRSTPNQSSVPKRFENGIPQIPQRFDPSSPVFARQRFSAPFPVQTPARSDIGKPSQDLLGVQTKELLLGPVQKLMWSFPSLPEEPQQPDVPFDLRYPVPANSVAAQCRENSIYVEVLKDFFGTGQLVMPSVFTLGGCTATGEDSSAQVLIFESELHACGSTSMVTANELVYMFSIIYTPKRASYGGPIVRSSGAVVGIECHYPRAHNVSSDALMPTWIPYATTLVAEEFLVFSLRLMTDDWIFERPANQYYLGDFINIEASVRSYNHVPLRVFVDRCVATSVPDTSAIPRYSFIENHGSISLVFSRWLQLPPLLMLSRKLAHSLLIGGCLPMRMIRCVAAVTQPVALGVEVICFLKICNGTKHLLDPSESRTVLVQCNFTAQWQNKSYLYCWSYLQL